MTKTSTVSCRITTGTETVEVSLVGVPQTTPPGMANRTQAAIPAYLSAWKDTRTRKSGVPSTHIPNMPPLSMLAVALCAPSCARESRALLWGAAR